MEHKIFYSRIEKGNFGESHEPLRKPNNPGSSLGRSIEQKKRSTSNEIGTVKTLMSISKRRNICVYCLTERQCAEDCNKVGNVDGCR